MLSGNTIAFESFPINEQLLDGVDSELADRMKWFAQGFYTVAQEGRTIRVYNMQCDMQGVRHFGAYKAPTAFYFQIAPEMGGGYELSTGMHPKE